MFVVGNEMIGKSYFLFGAREDMMSLSYPAFGAIMDKIVCMINYPIKILCSLDMSVMYPRVYNAVFIFGFCIESS